MRRLLRRPTQRATTRITTRHHPFARPRVILAPLVILSAAKDLVPSAMVTLLAMLHSRLALSERSEWFVAMGREMLCGVYPERSEGLSMTGMSIPAVLWQGARQAISPLRPISEARE